MPSDSTTRPDAASHAGDGEPPRVLVLHDSAMRAILTEHILTAAGCVVRTLTDARQLPEWMLSFQPDLILTGAPIAEASGVELAAVSRGPDALRFVPILVAAVDHRRQPRTDADADAGGAVADGSSLLSPERLVETLTQRIASMRARPQVLPVADHLDPDTGLATRRHFMHCLGRAITEPNIAEPGNGVLVVALDGVGHLNERRGIGAGDLATERVGRIIAEQLGQSDPAVRLDDYRHALLVRRCGAEALEKVADDLRRAVADTPCEVNGHRVTTSVSIGIGLFRSPADDVATLIKRAEGACAQAATGGGNRVVIDLPVAAGAQDAADDRRLIELIDQALSASDEVHGFSVFYQPMVAIGRQVLWHVELMLRLAAEDGTLIAAADFLPAAERAGRVAQIDRWTMLRALQVLIQEGPAQPRLRLFIRQHVEGLIAHGWLAWFRAQVTAPELAGRYPILDLHVQDLLRHRHLAGSLISSLRKAGLQVALIGVDNTPVVVDLVKELQPPFVMLAPVMQRLRQDRLAHFVRGLNHTATEVIACGIDFHDLVAPVWASGVGYVQGAVIHAPRPALDFDWDEVVTEQDG